MKARLTPPDIQRLVHILGAVASTATVFNPCQQGSSHVDICRANLGGYLQELRQRDVRLMLLGEAPGYSGSRWSGILVISEHLMIGGIATLDMLGATRGYQRTSPCQQRKDHFSAEPPNRWLAAYQQAYGGYGDEKANGSATAPPGRFRRRA